MKRVTSLLTLTLPLLLRTSLASGQETGSTSWSEVRLDVRHEHVEEVHKRVVVSFEKLGPMVVANNAIRRADGMIWITTPSGLLRFDGYEAVDYREPWSKPEARAGNWLSCLWEDEEQRLWTGSGFGLRRLDDRTRAFETFYADSAQPGSISSNGITSVCSDGRGGLWAATFRGLNRLDRRSMTFRNYRHDPLNPRSLGNDTVRNIIPDGSGGIWAATDAGLSHFDATTEAFLNYTPSSPPPFRLPGIPAWACLVVDRERRLWFASMKGLTVFDFARGTSRHYPHTPADTNGLTHVPVQAMAEGPDGRIWLGVARKGLAMLEPESGRFTYFTSPPTFSNIAPPQTILSLVADRDVQSRGKHDPYMFWATGELGVWKITCVHPPFGEIRVKRHLLDPPLQGGWKGIAGRNGEIWFSQYQGGGLVRLDLLNKRLTYVIPSVPGRPPLGVINAIARDNDGGIWVPTFGGLLHIVPDRWTARLFTPAQRASSILRTGTDTFWLGLKSPGQRGAMLGRWDRCTEQLTLFPREADRGEADMLGVLCQGVEDRNGDIWFGSFSAGLFRFSPSGKTYRRYVSVPGDSGAIRTNAVRAAVIDSAGTLWIGTDSGLQRYVRQADRFVHYPTTGAIRNDDGHFIRGMTLDDAGDLWLAHADGISRFVCSAGYFRDYSFSDGLDARQFAAVVYEPVTHRIVALTGSGRLFVFAPEELPLRSETSNVILTDFRVFERPVSLPEPISHTREVTIPYSQNFFSFRFSALEFLRPEKIHYAYTMKGFDKEWIRAGARAYAGYTNLDPGRYLFQVKATDANGVWSDSVTTLAVVISPPWWRTAWAYGGLVLAVAAGLVGLWRYDRRRVELRHQLEMKDFEARHLVEVDQLKARFFANISHEFRTPLTLILGPAEKIRTQDVAGSIRDEAATIYRNAQRLLHLVNQLLDLSRLDAGRMVLQVFPTDFPALVRSIVAPFLPLAERKRVSLVYDPQEDDLVVYTDRDKVEKIVTNLLSNAFKFTEAGGEVVVTVARREGPRPGVEGRPAFWAEVTVADTGIGIPGDQLDKVFNRFYQVDRGHGRDHAGTGIGLALTKELVDLHRGYIRVSSSEGNGSTFVVGFPMGKEAFAPEEIHEQPLAFHEMVLAPEVSEGPGPRNDAGGTAEGGAGKSARNSVVLLVEDHAEVRAYIRHCLEDEHAILEAADGMEGWEVAQTSLPDLVVSDIMMPRMNGIELCGKLKGDGRTSHIPVILLTARASSEAKVEGLETGADDYIIKPFEVRELQARVTNLIATRRAMQEKYRQTILLEPSQVPVTSADDRFLKKVMETVEQHIADPECGTETLAYELCMSRMQLNRKLQALTGHSTHEFLRLQRLTRAARLLKGRAGNISEVAYDVGFSSPSHFAKAFREQYGVLPSEYAGESPPVNHDPSCGGR